MSQLITWLQGGWVGDMAPGEAHGWIAWGGGLQAGDVISLMAHPIIGDPNAQDRSFKLKRSRQRGVRTEPEGFSTTFTTLGRNG
jgi:hypothetical protein